MALIKVAKLVNILDYLEFEGLERGSFDRRQFSVPTEMIPVLQYLAGIGIRLAYDSSKSQGIDIFHGPLGTRVGHVTAFTNRGWKKELVDDLRELANDPGAYGIEV